MRASRFLQWGIPAAVWLSCASPDEARIPECHGARQPLADAQVCDERELSRYTAELSDRILEPTTRALIRVEFDDTSRVRGMCVDQHTGHDTWTAERHVAQKLVEMKTIPSGPACVAGRRIDLNRYEAKLAEARYAQYWCGLVTGDHMKALAPCAKFKSDWILYDRTGSTRPIVFLASDDALANGARAGETLSRCGRTTKGFEDRSACIQSEGFELLEPPDR
jgi:hypothetical protein